jgi:hypothetical protein
VQSSTLTIAPFEYGALPDAARRKAQKPNTENKTCRRPTIVKPHSFVETRKAFVCRLRVRSKG